MIKPAQFWVKINSLAHSTAVSEDNAASAASTAYVNALTDDSTAATGSIAFSTAESTADLTDATALGTAYATAQSTADLTDADSLSTAYSAAVADDSLATDAGLSYSDALAHDNAAASASTSYWQAAADDSAAAEASTVYDSAHSTAALADTDAMSSAYDDAQSTADLTDAASLNAAYSTALEHDALASLAGDTLNSALDALSFTPDATVGNPFVVPIYDNLSNLHALDVGVLNALTSAETTALGSATDYHEALTYVAGLDTDNVAFEFNGDTYIYSDAGSNDQADTTDLLIILENHTDVNQVILDWNGNLP